jgi:SAM-dependent methyltransferase
MTDALIPPTDMLYDGSTSPEEFVLYGDNFHRDILLARVHPPQNAAILDLGCGNGQLARPLTRFLSPAGRYEGLDISLQSVEWLREHYRPHPNFHFHHADVFNKMYNPGGRHTPDNYRLPFSDATFDVAVLKSVFTHMMPAGVRNYLKEISRVLKHGGRCLITYFLLNEEADRFMKQGLDKMSLRHVYRNDDLCRVADPELPEKTVAHDEHRVRRYYSELDMSVMEISYGDWCGRPALLGLQDHVVARKI